MGIKATFTMQDIKKAFEEKARRMDAAIVSRFTYVGETFVRNARANGKYTDQTGNLRSSVCYAVYKDGIKRSPAAIPNSSKDVLEQLRTEYMKGYVLIVCAGMEYAAAVESKGKDVLTASSKIAKKDLGAALKTLKNAA